MALIYNKEFKNELTSPDGKFTITFGDEEENEVNEICDEEENESDN